MTKYLEAEKRLAELLVGPHEWNTDFHREYAEDFKWTRDNAAAFALMVEYGCYPTEYGQSIGINGSLIKICVRISDHPDKETAVRFAIVMAVITKLEEA